jgi:hypothetical protein
LTGNLFRFTAGGAVLVGPIDWFVYLRPDSEARLKRATEKFQRRER